MTEKNQNIVLAKFMGWKAPFVEQQPYGILGTHPDPSVKGLNLYIPEYTKNLNEIREVILKLSKDQQEVFADEFLFKDEEAAYSVYSAAFRGCSASAEVITEAALKALELWED